MTDKTDIAALRDKHELALKDLTERLTECNRLNFCMDELSAFAAFSSTVIDQLEAERQQREASEKERERIDLRNAELNSTLERWSVERAESANEIEELRAALRGEQEPVDERVIVAAADLFVIPSRNGVGSYYVTDAAEAMRISKRNDNSAITQYVTMRKYQELFTRQPKPVVVLPKSHYVAGCADKFMSEREVQGAMLAAGIVVQNGECEPSFRESSSSSTETFRENYKSSTNCPKCGGRGAYHCPQMLGAVECECCIVVKDGE